MSWTAISGVNWHVVRVVWANLQFLSLLPTYEFLKLDDRREPVDALHVKELPPRDLGLLPQLPALPVVQATPRGQNLFKKKNLFFLKSFAGSFAKNTGRHLDLRGRIFPCWARWSAWPWRASSWRRPSGGWTPRQGWCRTRCTWNDARAKRFYRSQRARWQCVGTPRVTQVQRSIFRAIGIRDIEIHC